MSQDFDPIAAEWVSYATNPNYSLVEKCLKLAQILEYPSLSISEYLQKIEVMGNELGNSISDVKNPAYLISMLNEYMFKILGFSGNHDDYYNPKNNFLNVVIDTKSGIPITLSVIYAEIGKYIGLDLRLVGFPSHFLVKHFEEYVLDPYGGGRLLTIDGLQEILDQNFGANVKFSPEFLNETEPEKILTRIVRNLKNSYTQSFNYDMAMHCTNMVLGIDPNSPEEIRDKGILESRLLHYDTALEFLNKYLDLAPEAEDVDFILGLIQSIRERSSQ